MNKSWKKCSQNRKKHTIDSDFRIIGKGILDGYGYDVESCKKRNSQPNKKKRQIIYEIITFLFGKLRSWGNQQLSKL